MPKTTGLSKGVKITYGSGLYQQKTKITKTNQNQQEIEKEHEKHIFEVSERQQLFYSDQLDVEDAAGGAHDVLMYPPNDMDNEWEDEETALNKLPPGEEGFFRSHTGDFGVCDFSHVDRVSYTNESLGYLGASPEKPTLAFAIDLLEIY
ncbi:LOW QUALITY PROTEIN: hypothetical protein CVT25_008543 [Psilocybe cyanescens]|uniref:Uncharacterized protein n=1 Tax=Psilocybe cyanescens TaxID=93625 RepID=A0A409WAG5_PSICY|nr:LOW QUALITY PROTEIN: hypothetical protein CVT25_008543 [Psilocybe cyanescens]